MQPRDILIAGAFNGNYRPVADVTCGNRLAYAVRNGYAFTLSRHSEDLRDLKAVSKEKAEFMLAALESSPWVFWMDMDAIFTDYTKTIEQFIKENPGKDFMICRDVNGPNNGIMLIRSTIETKAFMRNVLRMVDGFAHENAAMVSLFEIPEVAESINLAILENRAFNSMPYWRYPYDDKSGAWQQGDFVFHAPGMEIREKVEVIKEILPQVIR